MPFHVSSKPVDNTRVPFCHSHAKELIFFSLPQLLRFTGLLCEFGVALEREEYYFVFHFPHEKALLFFRLIGMQCNTKEICCFHPCFVSPATFLTGGDGRHEQPLGG